jgi:hypothetical protein
MNKQIAETGSNINRDIESLLEEIEELYSLIMEKRFGLEKLNLDLMLALDSNLSQDFQNLNMDCNPTLETNCRD